MRYTIFFILILTTLFFPSFIFAIELITTESAVNNSVDNIHNIDPSEEPHQSDKSANLQPLAAQNTETDQNKSLPEESEFKFESLIYNLNKLPPEIQYPVLSPLVKSQLEGKRDHKPGKTRRQIGGISCICISPDGNTLASGSYSGTIKLRDVRTRKVIATLWGHSRGVSSVCFSPDGTILASGLGNRKIKLFDVRTGRKMATLQGHSWAVSPDCSVCFSPDGNTLASGSSDCAIKLWNVHTHAEVATFQDVCAITSVRFSPDGNTIAAISRDESIRMWNIRTHLRYMIIRGSSVVTSIHLNHNNNITNPNNTIIAWGEKYGSIKLWNVDAYRKIATLQGHTEAVSSICISPNGNILASAAGDEINLWDLKSCKKITTLQGHTSDIQSICFSPDGNTLMSGSKGGTIRYWNYLYLRKIIANPDKYLTPAQMVLIYTAFQHSPQKLYLGNVAEKFKEKYGENLPSLLDLKHSFETLDPQLQHVLLDSLHVKTGKKNIVNALYSKLRSVFNRSG